MTMQKSKIEEIHNSGLIAIIDGDIQKIIGTCKPEHVEQQIQELQESGYSDVSTDIEGDIIAYGRTDNP